MTVINQITGEIREIRPQPGPQEAFLASSADIVIYGGAAGGGKTWGLLVEPLRHVSVGGFGGVIFRRSYPQITNEGGLWDESEQIYPYLGGRPVRGDMEWRWANGFKMAFKHLQYDDTVKEWQGAQVPFIGWDQLEHFSKYQFFYMLSRNRSTCGVRPYQRATINPDADHWCAGFIQWWWDPETGYPIEERSGVIRWFIQINNQIHWADTQQELIDIYGDPALPADDPEQVQPISVTFIPAKLTDNQILMKKDPGYMAKLKAMSLVEQERLLRGNWKIKPTAGKVFNAGWFEIVDAVPSHGRRVRRWDFAASEVKMKATKAVDDPDFTASCHVQYTDGVYYILDATADQINPTAADMMVKNYAKQDGKRTRVRWEEEGGASGKRDSAHLVKLLDGWDARGVRPKGDKIVRMKGLAGQAFNGNVKLLRGPWNQRWLGQMHGVPDLPHDDEPDAASGAHWDLTHWDEVRLPPSRSTSEFA